MVKQLLFKKNISISSKDSVARTSVGIHLAGSVMSFLATGAYSETLIEALASVSQIPNL